MARISMALQVAVLTSFSQQGFGTTPAFRTSWIMLSRSRMVGSSSGFNRDFCKAQHLKVNIRGRGVKRFAVVRGFPVLYSLRRGSGPILKGIGRKSFIDQLNKYGRPASLPLSCSPVRLPPPLRHEELGEEADLHAPLPSGQQGAGITGYNSFDNIRKYRPAAYQGALAAQAAFQKVKGFLPWYRKIMNALSGVSISSDSYGIGNLVFRMDAHSFSDLVQSRELTNKITETIGSGMLGRLEFTVDFIGLLGLGAAILDLARGIENERNLGGVGPQYDKWRRDQALKFVIGLLAEDLSRLDLRNSYFISRNVRDLVNEITVDLAEYKPLNDAFVYYLSLEDQLAQISRDGGTVPNVLPSNQQVMRPWP
jgi:hypothetical protein